MNFPLKVSLIFSTSLIDQNLEIEERLIETEVTISSKIIVKDYQLNICFPCNYLKKARWL